MKVKKIIILAFLLLFLFILTSNAREGIHSAAWALSNLLKLYTQDVKVHQLEEEFKHYSENYDIDDTLVKIARSHSIYLNKFRLSQEEDLFKLKEPFITKIQDKYCLVRIKDSYFEVVSEEGINFFTREEFLAHWSKEFISIPVVNVLVQRHGPENSLARIVFIYSYHNEEFYLFKEIFDKLYHKAKESKLKIIYLDELGLIPKETIEKLIHNQKVSEREAFSMAKKSLLDELELIEKGIGIYDPTKFYQKIYDYLAKFKIQVEMEDLQYENWKAIITFDDLNLNQLAVSLFCRANLDRYLETIKQYNAGFWQNNVVVRDRFFANQLEEIAEKNPSSIIFILRGLGHFGMEDGFKVNGFATETLILGEGGFYDLLVPDQLLQILKRNDVNIKPQLEKLFYLRAFPAECLRNYFQKKLGFTVTEATIKANKISSLLTESMIHRLSRDISHRILEGRLRTTDAIYEYVYLWVKQAKLIGKD